MKGYLAEADDFERQPQQDLNEAKRNNIDNILKGKALQTRSLQVIHLVSHLNHRKGI